MTKQQLSYITITVAITAGIVVPLTIHFTSKTPPAPIRIEQTIIGGGTNRISKTINITK